MDKDKPDVNRLTINYPEVVSKDNVKYYGSNIEVTFTAYDDASGIEYFKWEIGRAHV